MKQVVLILFAAAMAALFGPHGALSSLDTGAAPGASGQGPLAAAGERAVSANPVLRGVVAASHDMALQGAVPSSRQP